MDFELLFKEVEKANLKKSPFVIYRKPGINQITAYIQNNSALNELEGFTESGFVFAPFNNKQNAIIFPFKNSKILNSDFRIDTEEKESIPVKKPYNHLNNSYKLQHLDLVKKGLEVIAQGSILKVVLSRKEEVKILKLKLKLLFKKLLIKYPSAFVYIWYHPKVGLWIGATPESLLIVEGKNFKTMALAGTQLYIGSKEILWGKKEKEEQQIVTDYIVAQLKGFNLNVSIPYSKKAGSLLHICTEINGELNSIDQLGSIINKLHPTPAVCGLPKEKAKNFILKEENYNREFYTGFIGELNKKNTSSLYVNLRCMQIKDDHAILYVGGGITAESIPEKEWEETLAKSEIMKSIIQE